MVDKIIDIKVTGLNETIQSNVKRRELLDEPPIRYGVNAVADVWNRNFIGEGSMVGGWRELAEVTNKLRISRGYPPAHPILKQSGVLKSVVVDSLRRGQPRSMSGDGASMRYHETKRSAVVFASGRKVQNQFRQRTQTTDSPARPFWFVDRNVENAFKEGIWTRLARELGRIR